MVMCCKITKVKTSTVHSCANRRFLGYDKFFLLKEHTKNKYLKFGIETKKWVAHLSILMLNSIIHISADVL